MRDIMVDEVVNCDMDCSVFPMEILVEIGMSTWWAWGILRECCKGLHIELSKTDPYSRFTKKYVFSLSRSHRIREWCTIGDNVLIKQIDRDLGYEKVSFGVTKMIYRFAYHTTTREYENANGYIIWYCMYTKWKDDTERLSYIKYDEYMRLNKLWDITGC
jgi:hypothetical protein